MRSDWILDVLADLKAFALSNDLPGLAEQLDDTAIVALSEIARVKRGSACLTDGEKLVSGTDIGGVGS